MPDNPNSYGNRRILQGCMPRSISRSHQLRFNMPQWLHFLARANITLNSLLHFLQAISAFDESKGGGGPLRSGRPRPASDISLPRGIWDLDWMVGENQEDG